MVTSTPCPVLAARRRARGVSVLRPEAGRQYGTYRRPAAAASERGIRRPQARPTVRPTSADTGKFGGGTGRFGRTVAGITVCPQGLRRMLNTAPSQQRSRRMP
ncbi:hypothetical protein GCM10010168_03340 [Actinoplanes ianthinogenes]|uniref:Uncharacterized protein n=1 Tax=Actinoplanes ianthinogenes TaxID=122358 RepID=A0ABM7LUF3_9ACTN|nr:hypothetical protein Aiant_35830 [Actinoplanes ianthinogenes]GGQ91364.1 hypothetical protein GCM10010168_03340 [Actinoplanes ianthinogenes]